MNALAAELRRAQAIIENAADGIFHLDQEGRTTSANPEAERLFGWPEQDLLGKKLHDIIHYKRPDGSAFPMCECPLGNVFTTGEPLKLHEDVFWRRDGKAVPVACSNAAIMLDGQVTGSVLIVRDISERVKAEEHRQLLVNELNHRVKNTLSVVQSIARQSFRGGGEGAHLAAFEGRLAALAAAHDLLTDESWTEASLQALLTAVLRPFGGIGSRIVLGGPEVLLPPRAAVTMTLAAHELATNAAKYGALSTEAGAVHCTWGTPSDSGETRLHLEWREVGGPPVSTPTRRGFGSRMIERALAADMAGVARLMFEPAGLRCTVDAPIQAPR